MDTRLNCFFKLLTIVFLLSLQSCSSTNTSNPFYGLYSGFMSYHNNFIFSLKSLKNHTIEGMEDPKFYSKRKRIKVVDRNKEQLEYHYRSTTIRGFCEYFVVVNKDTKRIVDWGVENKEDAMKFCTGNI